MSTTTGQMTQADRMRNFVAEKLASGADKESVVKELEKSGVQEDVANRLVDSISHQPFAAPIEPTGTSSVQGAVLGGLVAAVLGGLIWGGLVILTGYEFGIVAWALGAVVGYAIVMFSKGEQGTPQQIAGGDHICRGNSQQLGAAAAGQPRKNSHGGEDAIRIVRSVPRLHPAGWVSSRQPSGNRRTRWP